MITFTPDSRPPLRSQSESLPIDGVALTPPSCKCWEHRKPHAILVTLGKSLHLLTVSLSGKQGCSMAGPPGNHNEHSPISLRVPQKIQLFMETSDLVLKKKKSVEISSLRKNTDLGPSSASYQLSDLGHVS